MSKSKKIFSLLIAVLMIANIFAISASALRDTTDKIAVVTWADKSKLVAGEEITIYTSFKLPAGADYSAIKFSTFQLLISYDKDVLTPVQTSATDKTVRTWNLAYDGVNGEGWFSDANVNSAEIVHNQIASTIATYGQGDLGLDATLLIACGYVTGNGAGVTAALGYSLAGGANDYVFSLKFKVNDYMPAGTTTYIGYTNAAFNKPINCYIRTIADAKVAYADVDLNNAMITLTDKNFAVAGTDAKVRPGTQAAPTSYIAGGVLSNLDLRLEAKFDKTAFDATYAPATAGAPCQNITECGFIVAKTTDLANGAADLTVANANGTTIRKASVGKIQDKTTYYNMVLAISGIPAAELATEYTYVAYITNGAETIYSAPATAAAADRDYLAIPGVDSLAA
ncbi:MAG: hypothetical protein GX862_11820 [Leucobacter sp.]|nr:hypothetical protein [Leucobacter sp.]